MKVKIQEPKFDREMEITASTDCSNGTVRHNVKIEMPIVGTRKREADKKGIVKPSVIAKVLKYARQILDIIISIINVLINAGYFRHQ